MSQFRWDLCIVSLLSVVWLVSPSRSEFGIATASPSKHCAHMSDCRLWPPAQVPQTDTILRGCSKYREWTARWMQWRSDLRDSGRLTAYRVRTDYHRPSCRPQNSQFTELQVQYLFSYVQTINDHAGFSFFSICCSRSWPMRR
ncbi:hypothetical protein ACQKWADRAFT_304197 [Trichoderma austrokoningii]